MTTELVKMSPKGQLVIPQELRQKMRYKPGDRFVAFDLKEGVIFKKVEIPDMQKEFDKLAQEIAAQFKRQKVVPKDVSEAVAWARKRSS